MRLCSVDGCGKRHFGRGFCPKHHWRWRKHGDPLAVMRLKGGEQLAWLRDVALLYEGDECLPWPFGVTKQGYGMVTHEDGSRETPHRYVCRKAHGEPAAPSHEVRHLCPRNRRCVAKRHLAWGTRTENALDRHDHGTMIRGEGHPWHKLTEGEVVAIRNLQGVATQREIARKHDVSTTTVRDIWKRRRWGWLPEERMQ
jgi:hypothetical protein